MWLGRRKQRRRMGFWFWGWAGIQEIWLQFLVLPKTVQISPSGLVYIEKLHW